MEREIHFSEKEVKEVFDGQSSLALQQCSGPTSCCLVFATYAADPSFLEWRAWPLSSEAPNLLTETTPFPSPFLDTSCEEARAAVFNPLAFVRNM